MDYVSLLIGVAVGGAIGFLLAKLMKNESAGLSSSSDSTVLKALQSENEKLATARMELDKANGILQGNVQAKEDEIATLKLKQAQERDNHEKLIAENADWKARYGGLEQKLHEQKAELEQLQQKFTTEFENIANKILDQKSEKFTEKNKENLEGILEPLKERIKTFEDKVDKTYKNESEERISLKTEIKHLMDLNKQLSNDANNLATALKGESKTQGDWGELQLQMILERAGLHRDLHFSTQQSFRDDEGHLKRPDFVIHLPDNKHLIIDSKVSLTAYNAFFNAETEEERALHLKAHLNSINNHIKDLSEKSYQSLYEINTPDYVLMFIPIESAFTLAFQNDDELFMKALKKDIVIVTTSTLLATMRTVSFIWRQEDQKKNVLEIARQGGDLYDKFVAFVNDLESVGGKLDQARKSYDGAMNKLVEGRGNLVKRAETIRKLGVKTSKAMPQAILDESEENHENRIKERASKALEEPTADEVTIDETTQPDA